MNGGLVASPCRRSAPPRGRVPRLGSVVGLAVLATLAGCRQDMYDQPRYDPLEPSAFFADGASARPLVRGTVAVGQARIDEPFYTGRVADELVETIPVDVDLALLKRGQQRYTIFCAPCHGGVGDGRGMIVERGFSPPRSFHIDELREVPIGHFFDVITHGYGAMYSYASRVPPPDRWAIAAYIRTLQLSQDARIEDVPEAQRALLLGQDSPPDQETRR